MSDVENNKTLVRRFIQALDTDELGILEEICTPEVAKEWRDGINYLERHMIRAGQ